MFLGGRHLAEQPKPRPATLTPIEFLLSALNFYADPGNWVNGRCMGDRNEQGLRPRDEGRVARMVLTKLAKAQTEHRKQQREGPGILGPDGTPALVGAH